VPARNQKSITVGFAIAVGLICVNIPVLPIMLGVPLLALLSTSLFGWSQTVDLRDAYVIALLISLFLLGFVLAWTWWAVMVPRWRLWAYERVTDIPKLKRWAVAVGLTWPDGHIFGRTEIKSKAHAASERELETLKS